MARSNSFKALKSIMSHIGCGVNVVNEVSPPCRDFKSRVDFCISSNQGKILVEVKSVVAMEAAMCELNDRSYTFNLVPGCSLKKKHLNKVRV